MSLNLSEVAKARRRLAEERQRSRETLGKLCEGRNLNAKPIFTSVRSPRAA